MDIDTRLLRYFVAVFEEGNLTRAAEQLHISQPALTKQIRQLEVQLGVVLFIRSRAGMAPTEAGEALAAHANDVLTAWERTLRATRAATTRATHTLRVGFVASAANEYTPLIIADFARRSPGWRVQMRQTEWTDPTAGLATGEVDVALLRLPVPTHSDFEVEVLLTEPRWIACPRDITSRRRTASGSKICTTNHSWQLPPNLGPGATTGSRPMSAKGTRCVSARSPTTPMNGSTRSLTDRASASPPRRPPASTSARTSSTGQ